MSPTSRISTNRLEANVSTPQQSTPTSPKEIVEIITETVDYTELPENVDVKTQIVNEAMQTSQLSDTGIHRTTQVSSFSPSFVNNVVTTQTTVSTATETVSSRRGSTSATQPLLQSTTLPFVAAQNENSPTVMSSSRKPTTLSFDFTTVSSTRVTSKSLLVTTNSRTFPASPTDVATSLQSTPTYRTSNRPVNDRLTELLMRATTNATSTPSINPKTTLSISSNQTGGVPTTRLSVSPGITGTPSKVSPSTSITNSPPITSSPITSRGTTTLPPGTTSIPTSSPSTSSSQTTLLPSTSRIQTISSTTSNTPTVDKQTTTLTPSTKSITTTATTTLPTTAFTTTQTVQSTSKTEQWSSSATPKISTYFVSTKSTFLTNSTPSTSTEYRQSTNTSELLETTSSSEATVNITIIYIDDESDRGNYCIFYFVINLFFFKLANTNRYCLFMILSMFSPKV